MRATLRAIAEGLRARGYSVALLNRGRVLTYARDRARGTVELVAYTTAPDIRRIWLDNYTGRGGPELTFTPGETEAITGWVVRWLDARDRSEPLPPAPCGLDNVWPANRWTAGARETLQKKDAARLTQTGGAFRVGDKLETREP